MTGHTGAVALSTEWTWQPRRPSRQKRCCSDLDFITFGVMLWLLHAGPSGFRTGCFVESIATQTLVIYVIRTLGCGVRAAPLDGRWADRRAAGGRGCQNAGLMTLLVAKR